MDKQQIVTTICILNLESPRQKRFNTCAEFHDPNLYAKDAIGRGKYQ